MRRIALKLSTALAALLVAASSFAGVTTQASPPPGYYDSVGFSSSARLRATLHELIDDHTRYPYTSSATDTWDILEQADEDPNNASNILDVYWNASYPKAGGGNSNYNREHTWPKSYGFPINVSDNYPFTDAHALFLSDSGYNSSRSNLPYRGCSPGCTEKPTVPNNGDGGDSGTYPGGSNWRSGSGESGTWETWRGRRGDVARALFYMDVRYEGGQHSVTSASEPDLVLTNVRSWIVADSTANRDVAFMGDLNTLLAWHLEDPVDSLERHRNDVIFGFQGNRNPFIDHPEWASVLYGSLRFFSTGSGTTTPSPTPTPPDLNGGDDGDPPNVAMALDLEAETVTITQPGVVHAGTVRVAPPELGGRPELLVPGCASRCGGDENGHVRARRRRQPAAVPQVDDRLRVEQRG